jgi:pimeloyl-ACP methyl ester carboxylesterase
MELAFVTADDGAETQGVFYYPRGGLPKAAVYLMHPRGEFSRHYAIPGLVEAGYACFGHNSRYLNNDTECIHERLNLDIAAGMRWLLKRGIKQVVLLGNSGGGSLFAYYQSQAELPAAKREEMTPGGSRIDMSGEMPQGAAFIAVAAHPGEGIFLLESIDPSVTDENDPLSCDPELDMFNPDNGYDVANGTAKYDAQWFARYREAQRQRVLRLDAIARAQIAREREGLETARVKDLGGYALVQARRRGVPHRLMVIYRTIANPAYLDLSIDANDRELGTIFGLVNRRPEFGNYFTSNISRVMAPRAWLSTWSGTSSKADFAENAAGITIPTLFVPAKGDSDILPSAEKKMWAAITAADRTRVDLPGADHYLQPLPGADPSLEHPRVRLNKVMVDWLASRVPPV